MAKFPSQEWLQALVVKLNEDARYAEVARNWEGDMLVVIEPGGALDLQIAYYIDLWHGKCRAAYPIDGAKALKPVVSLRAPYENYVRLLKSEIEPMQALLTRKLGVQGNMAILMRNVPTVLEFVRCCREITNSYMD